MIEIQVHPSDIRRKVRYFFFGRRAVAAATVALSCLLIVVIGSMAAAPSVIRRVYKSSHLQSVRAERDQQKVSLKQNVDQMARLERTLDEQSVRVQKLMAIYGLDLNAHAQGGLSLSRERDPGNLELVDAQMRERQLRRAMSQLQRQVELIASYEAANADMVRHTPSILPLPASQFVLTSPFGGRISPFTRSADFHKGLDLAAPTGTPIFSAADGVVTFAGRYPISQSVAWWRFGNVVVVNHADRFITIYAHCDSTRVRAGDRVKQGEVIATVGSTGWSTNSHLHYEVRTDIERPGVFEPIDPRIYILNYQWKNEEKVLISRRASKEYRDLDPIPAAFIGRRRV